ncbi:MAG: ATP-binding protein [Paludibacteraceae bacterium]|nr:ATP-binding protein [Paludibacteraceae bacterium]
MSEYRPRIADQLLTESLEALGAVLVQGTKWCGKTTTSVHHANSVLYMDDPTQKAQNLALAQTNIKQLLAGATPRVIDEWELAPELWDAARFEVDHRDEHVGQFIFTGSAVPKEKDKEKMFHSGAGRFDWITMRPMSLWESGDSTGDVRITDLFDGAMPEGTSSIDLDRLAFLTCRGGWPGALTLSENAALHVSRAYLKAVVNSDINRVDDVKRDPDLMLRIIRSLARNQGEQIPYTTIRADVINNEKVQLSDDTVESYVKVLKKIFLEEDMRAWNPNLRSKTAIRTTDTRYFVDSSIATAALGLGPKDLINDLIDFGFYFETLAVRDLRVYADALDGEVFHYRDKNGLECDAVLHRRNGSYGLIEIKIGGADNIEKGAKTLKDLASKIDTTKMKAPAFMMVVTGIGQYAYRRPDGVCVVPIGCLKP